MARLVLDGYQRRVPLEDIELEALGVAWAARSAVTIAISSWRAARGLEDQEFAERYNAECLQMLDTIEAAGWDELSRLLGAAGPQRPDASLAGRRDAAFGPAFEPLFYAEPVEVAHAEGVWITDAAGVRYLDAYNNVPCVGHGHPRVAAAIARQSRLHQHPHALPASDRDRARRAARGDMPAGARHRDARQLGLRGQRPGLAHRDRGHGARRRALHRVRLPRHHGGHGRALARGLARRRRGRSTSRPGMRRTPTAGAISTRRRSPRRSSAWAGAAWRPRSSTG